MTCAFSLRKEHGVFNNAYVLLQKRFEKKEVLATCYAYSAGISIAGVPSSDPVLGIHKILLRMPYWCPPVFQPDSSLNLLFVDSTARMWHQFRRTMVPAHWPWPPEKDQRKDVTNDCSPARCFLNKDQAEGWKGQKMIIQWNLVKIQQFQRTSFCGASLKRDFTIMCIGQSEPCRCYSWWIIVGLL